MVRVDGVVRLTICRIGSVMRVCRNRQPLLQFCILAQAAVIWLRGRCIDLYRILCTEYNVNQQHRDETDFAILLSTRLGTASISAMGLLLLLLLLLLLDGLLES